MQSIKKVLNSVYPSLAEVYAQEYKDDKEKIQALLVKVYERLDKIRIQLSKRVENNWGESKVGYCTSYFDYLRRNAEDEVYNLVALDFNRILDVITKAKDNQNANRKERRHRSQNIKALECDLMLMDIIDYKRKTLIEVNMLFEGTEPLKYRELLAQMNAFEEIVGLIAICTDESNHVLKQKIWVGEQEIRIKEWRHRELAESHQYAVNDNEIIDAYREYDTDISSLMNYVQVSNLSNMIRMLKLALDGDLSKVTPSLVSDLLLNKKELITTLMNVSH